MVTAISAEMSLLLSVWVSAGVVNEQTIAARAMREPNIGYPPSSRKRFDIVQRTFPLPSVMRGLDPRIDARRMDCRVKPGNDDPKICREENYPATLPHCSVKCSAPRSAVAKMV